MRNDITRLRSNNVISHGNVYFYLLSIFTKFLDSGLAADEAAAASVTPGIASLSRPPSK